MKRFAPLLLLVLVALGLAACVPGTTGTITGTAGSWEVLVEIGEDLELTGVTIEAAGISSIDNRCSPVAGFEGRAIVCDLGTTPAGYSTTVPFRTPADLEILPACVVGGYVGGGFADYRVRPCDVEST